MFRCSVYEKAYLKAVEMSALAGNKEYENYFSGMVQGILDEKAKHLKRAEERGEKIEQKEILRATKDYTDLLTKAYTGGNSCRYRRCDLSVQQALRFHRS